MAGECCGADWIAIDEMGPVSVVRTNELEMTFQERYAYWISAPLTGPASSPFILNDTHLDGPRGLDLVQEGTYAYVINQYSGELSTVDLDPDSPYFGGVRVVKEEIYVLCDIHVTEDETVAYLGREAGPRDPPQGQNVITKLYLESGEVVTLVDQFDQPTSFVLNPDESEAYVVDHARSGLFGLDMGTSVVTPIATGLKDPFAVDVAHKAGFAYVLTNPSSDDEDTLGGLLRISLRNGALATVVQNEFQGPTSIALDEGGRVAFITEYGHEGACDGSLSVINIDSQAGDYRQKLILVTGLCGPHDVVLDEAETMAYFVEVESSRMGVIRIDMTQIFPAEPDS
jgi:DNA-binding beta-propeller fold protein YncE